MLIATNGRFTTQRGQMRFREPDIHERRTARLVGRGYNALARDESSGAFSPLNGEPGRL
jgi:hypothetical protein